MNWSDSLAFDAQRKLDLAVESVENAGWGCEGEGVVGEGEGEYYGKIAATTSFDLSQGSHQVALAKLQLLLVELERIFKQTNSSKIQSRSSVK